MTDVQVRIAAESDERQLAELDAASWPLEVQVSPPQPASASFFASWRRPDDVLVAVQDGDVLGYVRLGRHVPIEANDHVLHIDALVVKSEARGLGVGSMLVAAAIDEARRRGVRKLGLRALSNNPGAIRLYERHGFTEEGRLREEFRRPDGTYADDVWMARWLR